MGYWKGEGICWSGKCKQPGTIPIGADEQGRQQVLCERCYKRTEKAIRSAAEKIMLALSQPGTTVH